MTAVWLIPDSEADGADRGRQSADWRGEAVVGGVGEGEEEEDEEDHAQHVGGEDGGPVRVLQSRADGREAHVVTEGVAEHRTHQVTCNTQHWLFSTVQGPSPALIYHCILVIAEHTAHR